MVKLLLAVAIAVLLLVEAAIRRRARLETPGDHLRAGDGAYRRGDVGLAAEHYREAVRLEHRNPEAHYKLAGVAWEQDDYDSVIEHLRECQRWAPEVADVEHGLGAAHYRKGDYQAALQHYRRALDLEPEDEEIRGGLAALYHELGQEQEAREVWPEYEPASAEEREREERVERQLRGRGERQLQRWNRTAHTVRWVGQVARIGVAVWALWLVLTWVYELVRGPGTAPTPSRGFVLVAGVAVGALWGAMLLLRAMEASRDRYLRRAMRGAGVSTGDIEATVPRGHGPPWWRVELSGLHLVLWLAIPFFVSVGHWEGCPDWLAQAALVMGFIWVLKVCCWLFLLFARPHPQHGVRKVYRWAGTLPGSLVLVVAVPVGVFLFGVLTLLIADLLGY
jgi:hypothetical protein